MGLTLTDILLFGKATEASADNGKFRIYRRNILRWKAINRYIEVVVSGVTPLILPDAIEADIPSLIAFGGTEQNNTPTPDAPTDIVCNNGVLRIQGSATGTVTQTGDPTPTTPVEPEFYQNHGLLLRAIGTDADTYDATTQTITRAIGYHIFTGTENFGTSTTYGKALYINAAASSWGGARSKDVLCQYFLGTSAPSSAMPASTCFFNASGHFYFRTSETDTDFKAWLAELYANGTPLIVWFVNSTPETESFTPSVYADGTQETINIHTKNLSPNELDNVGYNSTGATSSSSTFCGNLQKIKCAPGDKFTVSCGNFPDGISGVFVNTWKTDGTWNQRQAIAMVSSYTYTIPAGIGEVNFTLYKTGGITIGSTSWLQVERGDTPTQYQPYFNGGTAVAEMLLKVGDYQDQQEIIDGTVTRNVGVKVLNGTEDWQASGSSAYQFLTTDMLSGNFQTGLCTHFDIISNVADFGIRLGATNARIYAYVTSQYATRSDWTTFLANQYAAGTPVIVIYPLATPTTESVAGQSMSTTQGDNIAEITQASLSGLELEVKYKAAVSLTIEEVQDANLDPNVEVTIQ